jgi:hypothetical protein
MNIPLKTHFKYLGIIILGFAKYMPVDEHIFYIPFVGDVPIRSWLVIF